MLNPPLDAIDLKILRILQTDGRISNADLADRIGLSPTPCLRRLRRLEKEGVITGYRAQLDRSKLGLGITVLVDLKVEGQKGLDLARLQAQLKGMPEILSCHFVAGEFDLMLEVTVPDLADYEGFLMERLALLKLHRDIRSHVVIRTVADGRPLPLDHLQGAE